MSGVTNGALQGTNGRAGNPLLQAYAAGAALLLAAILVNIGSHLHEQPGLPAWKPITWETTSFAGCLAGMWIVFGAVRVIGARRHPLPVSLALHWAAATIFSAVHCLIMWSLRRLVFTLAGAPYGWHMPLGQALYEYRKDLITYIILAGLYWGLCRLAETRAPPPSMPRPAPFGAPSFDIRDGTNLLRVPVADIVAAESAGNYVTILLSDGRKKLMRATLGQTEAELAAHGFLRVHRSWVVNPGFIREIDRTESGDHRLALHGGLAVPMSRRYKQAAQTVLKRQPSAPL
jgi:hypothetical protein